MRTLQRRKNRFFKAKDGRMLYALLKAHITNDFICLDDRLSVFIFCAPKPSLGPFRAAARDYSVLINTCYGEILSRE
jgi:hypothetical protein